MKSIQSIMSAVILLMYLLLLVDLPPSQGQTLYKHNVTLEQLEDSWAWLSGGVSFMITGILLIVIFVLFFFTARSLWENVQRRDEAQIKGSDSSR